MALKLRLMRKGMKKFPSYRIVAMHEASRRDGAFVADLGHYSPTADICEVDEALAEKLLEQGAVPTETVRNILRKKGILQRFNEKKEKRA